VRAIGYLCLFVLFAPLALAPFVSLTDLHAHARLDGSAWASAEGFYKQTAFYDTIVPQNRTEVYEWQGTLESLFADTLAHGWVVTGFVLDAVVLTFVLGLMHRPASLKSPRSIQVWILAVASAWCFLLGLLFFFWTLWIPDLCEAVGMPREYTHRERFEFSFISDTEDIQGKAWVDAVGMAGAAVSCRPPFSVFARAALLTSAALTWLAHIVLQLVLGFFKFDGAS